MRLVSLSILIALFVLAGLPGVQATPGSGNLSFVESPVFEGTLSGEGPGEAHATDRAAELVVRGARVDVLKVWYETEVFGPVRTNTGPVQKEWTNFTNAELRLEVPGERFEALIVTTGATTLRVADVAVVDHVLTAVADPWLVVDDSGVEDRQREGEERVFTYAAEGDRFLAPSGPVTGEGSFMVYLEETTFFVRPEHGDIDRFSSGTERIATTAAYTKDQHAYHLVHVTGGSVRLAGADVATWLARPIFTFTGELSAPQATGSISVGEETHTLTAEPVTVAGVLEFRPRPIGQPQPYVSENVHVGTTQRSGGAYPGLSSELSGDVTMLAIGQIPYISESDLTIVASAGVLTLVAAVLLLTPKGKWVALTILAPLYAKTERSRLLDNESRDRIFQAIRNNPGINLSQIHRLAELGWGVTVYHLKMLEKSGLVFSESSSRDKCFFENEPRFRSLRAAIAAIANKEPAQRVASAVAAHPGLTQRDVIAQTGLTQRAVSYYVGKLGKQGLLEARRDGNFVRYQPSERLVDALRFVSHDVPAVTLAGPAAGADIAQV